MLLRPPKDTIIRRRRYVKDLIAIMDFDFCLTAEFFRGGTDMRTERTSLLERGEAKAKEDSIRFSSYHA